jgi:RNA recognition motif-containing protein
MSNSKLFVGNMAHSLNQQELERMFAAHGTVIDVKVPVDRESGRPRGFAFVTMATPEAAQAAIQALNGQAVDDKKLTVSEARPREERPAFNRGGRDFRHGGGRPGGGGGGGRRY